MVDGQGGPAQALAMSILVRMADVYGASELMDISQAHIDSTIYLGDATLEFAERLASLGAKVAVPTSLNVSGVDDIERRADRRDCRQRVRGGHGHVRRAGRQDRGPVVRRQDNAQGLTT